MTGYLSKPPAGVQLNKNHPLAQGLVGCWLFNEGSGLRTNDLAGNNTGTLNGFEPMSSSNGWTGGNFGTALMFNGSSTFIDVTTNPSLNLGKVGQQYTIEARINSKGSSDAEIVSKGISGKFPFTIREFGTFSFEAFDGTHIPAVFITKILNQWVDLVGVYDRVNIYGYMNGTLRGSVADTTVGDISENLDVNIGTRTNTGSHFFNGAIDLVRIWKRALNATEIQKLYAQPYDMFKLHM